MFFCNTTYRITFKSEGNQAILNDLIKEVKGCNPTFHTDQIRGRYILVHKFYAEVASCTNISCIAICIW